MRSVVIAKITEDIIDQFFEDFYNLPGAVRRKSQGSIKINDVYINMSRGLDRVFLEEIFSEDMGKGKAKDALNKVLELADKYKIPLELEANPYRTDEDTKEFVDQQKRLIAWYKSVGFKSKLGATHRRFMYRVPK